MPFKTSLGLNYDCGDFPKNMADVLEFADWRGFEERKAESNSRGMLRGIGIANAIERAGSPGLEFAEIRFDISGAATLLLGSLNQGQGHETTFKQIASEKLGLRPEDMRIVQGDTDIVAFGMGTMGSRSYGAGTGSGQDCREMPQDSGSYS